MANERSNPLEDDSDASEGTPDVPRSLAPLPKLDGVVVGRLIDFSDAGEPRVDFAGNALRSPIPARTTVPLDAVAVGRDVVLVFESGDPERPIVLGSIQPNARSNEAPSSKLPLEVDATSERLELSANQEIVLRVGKASITLTRAGKILLRGAYLLSRSSGVNRIKGGSVQIN